MVTLNTSLYTGFSGVQTAQNGLNITGNNIANVNTEGYSRQSADIIERGVMRSGSLTQGLGSTVRQVMAARDMITDELLTRQMGKHAYQEELAAGLNSLEGLLAEGDGTGIGEALSEFFAGLEAATLRPADIGTRQELIALGDRLAAELRSRDSDLYDQQAQSNDDLITLTDDVNEITARIESLNRSIGSQVSPPQDLIDQRYMEINKLSELVSVETFQLTNNMVQVNLAGPNVILVGREIRNTLGTAPNITNNSLFDVTFTSKNNTSVLTSQINGGKIGAKLQLRDTEIGGVRDKLDELAGALIVQFNGLHSAGFDLNGNAGGNFFDPPNPLGAIPVGTVDPDRYRGLAGSIRLSTDLEDPGDPGVPDPARLALAGTTSAGDNANAIAMANLRTATGLVDTDRDGDPAPDGSESFEKFFNTVLSDTGRRVRSANDSLDTQIALLEQAEVRREQVSGVSLDEEAVHLSQFQRAFEASSRYLNVINQLTAEILNRLG